MSGVSSAVGGLVKLVVVGVAVLAVIAGVSLVIKGELGEVWDRINPLDTETVDRTAPPVLKSLSNLSEYHAASGYYEVIVDLEEKSKLPDWLKGERVLYVGKGTVDALVDFSKLDERSLDVSDSSKSVRIQLPNPTIETPDLNLKKSRLYSHDTGLLDTFSGSEIERKAQLKAVGQIAAAARDEADLLARAKENTTSMLRGLLAALGYTNVKVTFSAN